MRRVFLAFAVVLALGAVAIGCAKKSQTASSETSSDSLLATNPVEQPQGNLTPQQQYQPNQEQQQTPPTPAPTASETPHTAKAAKPHHTSKPSSSPSSEPVESRGATLAAGTPIEVTVSTPISTDKAQVGDTWTGEVKDNVIVGNTVVIPSGSTVSGVVNAVQPAQRGTKASLSLAVKSISVNGREHMVSASTEPIVAGSPRARNLGAMAGGAAAGALIGKAVGGGGKGALIGGLIGGAAAGAGVAASKGYQVVVKEGTTITFSVNEAVMVKS